MNWHILDNFKVLPESTALIGIVDQLKRYEEISGDVHCGSLKLIERIRCSSRHGNLLASVLEQINLASPEGTALMRICEAVLRTRNTGDRDQLIREQLSTGEWEDFGGNGGLVGKAMRAGAQLARALNSGWFGALGEDAVRGAVVSAINSMAGQFVLGRDIHEALKRARSGGLLCSFDMLGEGARSLSDADRYEAAYRVAIETLAVAGRLSHPTAGHGISVKLSALYPRYDAVQSDRVMRFLYPRLERLMNKAADANIGFFIDAEEMDRLVVSLEILEQLARAAPTKWEGLGVAVQAYQRRSLNVVSMLIDFAKTTNRRLMLRLVKGAYWDTEIRRAQLEGLSDYAVFTTKAGTDCSYLACAEVMLNAVPAIYPAFATHNAHTVEAIRHLAINKTTDFEFQRLHGMGEDLYSTAIELWREAGQAPASRIRVYAPVGRTDALLGYLVRRLLENGANSSFVFRGRNKAVKAEDVVADPLAEVKSIGLSANPNIPPPRTIFGPERVSASGVDFSILAERLKMTDAIASFDTNPICAVPLVNGDLLPQGMTEEIRSPADNRHVVGTVDCATANLIETAYATALNAQPAWNAIEATQRADILRAVADKLECNMLRFAAILAREAGKVLKDGIAEVREAVDFCRYYAQLAECQMGKSMSLKGPTGETNGLTFIGRGVFVCISPWNFPLAIFVGQVAAALVTGNAVLAKPAPQTPLVAFEAVKLFLDAGLPSGLLSYLPGNAGVGELLVQDPRHAGVAFTGSIVSARHIHRSLAGRNGSIAPLIAETGGINGMFVDSTALPEQVIDDALSSAFGSAGQRCSSARLLFIPESIYSRLTTELIEAKDVLCVGDPAFAETDIGPIIDQRSCNALSAHVALLQSRGIAVHQHRLGAELKYGTFFAPAVAEISSLREHHIEVFGPIIHVMRYKDGMGAAIARELSAKGYGLTLGIHSRLTRFVDEIKQACPVGNVYVNRPIIGASVGVQPFGGIGLSGTGTKAGGPYTLFPFAFQQVISEDLSARGGNLALINLGASTQ